MTLQHRPLHPKWHHAIAVLLLLPMEGCKVGSDYTAPTPLVPKSWEAQRSLKSPTAPLAPESLAAWWKTLKDPVLDQLMIRAAQGNLDLKIALSRIDEARAERRAQRAELFPKVSALAVPADIHNVFPFPQQAIPASGLPYFLAGFDAVWEIDIVGRLQRKLEASSAASEGAVEDYRQAWLLLVAEVAREYITYRDIDQQLKIVNAKGQSQEKILNLNQTLATGGLLTADTLDRTRVPVSENEGQKASLEAQRDATRHRLEIVTGLEPGDLLSLLWKPVPIPEPPSQIFLTAPFDIIRNRPDIRGAERDLAAATATQGAALAELFPKISVVSFLGFHNSDLENLFKSSAFAWAATSQIAQPIFNFGKIRAGIDMADARQKAAYLTWEKTILAAVHETESALILYLKEVLKREQLLRSVASLKHALELSEVRQSAGLSSLIEVEQARQALLLEEAKLEDSKAQTVINLIALYKALGGAGSLPIQTPEDPIRPWG